jgi:hypothetical protein
VEQAAISASLLSGYGQPAAHSNPGIRLRQESFQPSLPAGTEVVFRASASTIVATGAEIDLATRPATHEYYIDFLDYLASSSSKSLTALSWPGPAGGR